MKNNKKKTRRNEIEDLKISLNKIKEMLNKIEEKENNSDLLINNTIEQKIDLNQIKMDENYLKESKKLKDISDAIKSNKNQIFEINCLLKNSMDKILDQQEYINEKVLKNKELINDLKKRDDQIYKIDTCRFDSLERGININHKILIFLLFESIIFFIVLLFVK